jgi:hypothetical protein
MFNREGSRRLKRTEGEEATSTNGVSDSFQKMRSDSGCIIRRDAILETGNERQERSR